MSGASPWSVDGRLVRALTIVLTPLVALGCLPLVAQPPPGPTRTPMPSPWPTLEPVATWPPTATPEPPDSGWQVVYPGVEYRRLRVTIGETIEWLTIVRVEPSVVRFRVLYDPLSPRSVRAWAQRLGQPLLVINGGYFTPENEALGLLVSDGKRFGASFGDFAGMFAVSGAGQVSVRWLRDWPYDPQEPLQQAVQSFPVLIKPGGVMGFPADADDGRPARRSLVAEDTEGRILFLIAPNGYFSLHRLATFLAGSDLGLDVALNLDGGTSSGLWLRLSPTPLVVDSLVPLPSVIAVEVP